MRKYTLLLSVTVHVVAAFALIIAPLFAAASLPSIHDVISFVPVTVTPPPPPALGGGSTQRTSQPVPQQAQFVPTTPPDHIAAEIEQPLVATTDFGTPGGGPIGSVGGGPGGEGVSWGVVGGAPVAPVVVVPPVRHEPVRIGGDVIPPKKIRDVSPIYPQVAVVSRTQGVVILEAVIGEDGSVREVKVLRSVRLLDQAAMEAVRQWRFTPTLLSGQPVPIVMTVTVDFKLN
jgi:protein TonB